MAEAGRLWIERAEAEKLESSMVAKYRNHVEVHIKPHLGAVKLAKLTAPHVEQFKEDTLKRLSWPMAGKVLGSLKAILGDAQRRGWSRETSPIRSRYAPGRVMTARRRRAGTSRPRPRLTPS